MAGLIAVRIRDLARKTLLNAGGRGFMRFAEEGGALLVTDAVRRCDNPVALAQALECAGFSCCDQEELLYLTPQDMLLKAVIGPQGLPEIRWEEMIHPVQVLAVRWLSAPEAALTRAGRQLVLETLRLTGTPGRDVLTGLEALRAQAAVMLRSGDRSGMREAGAVLAQWCESTMNKRQEG